MSGNTRSEAYIELSLGENAHARIWVTGDVGAAVREVLSLARDQSAPAGRRAGKRIKPQLAPLIEAGLLNPGQELTWHRPRIGEQVTITVTADGQLRIPDGSVWPSPFQAASRITGYPADGWALFKAATGQSLADLKAALPNPDPEDP